MDVIINELTSTVEVTADEALLDPLVLRRIVSAVTARLRDDEQTREWEARERQVGRTGRR